MSDKNNALVDTLKRELDKKQAEVDKLKGKQLKEAIKTDDAFAGFSGQYKDLRTGDIFALKVCEAHEVRHNRTHIVKNATHSGDYTAADFRRLFDKL